LHNLGSWLIVGLTQRPDEEGGVCFGVFHQQYRYWFAAPYLRRGVEQRAVLQVRKGVAQAHVDNRRTAQAAALGEVRDFFAKWSSTLIVIRVFINSL